MKKKLVVFFSIFLTSTLIANETNFSVIGNLQSHYQKNNGFEANIEEIELAWQSPLTANIQANIIYAIHNAGDGTYEAHAEEVYFNIPNLPESLLGIKNNLGIGGKLGKKLIPFGKNNLQHPEQWKTISKPLAFLYTFGPESLNGTGIQFEYLLPLPFFTQLEIGQWEIESPEEEESEFKGNQFSVGNFGNVYTNARIWSAFTPTDTQEIELGLSHLIPKNNSSQKISGMDITYKNYLGSSKILMLRTEYLNCHNKPYESDVRGGYVLTSMLWNPTWETGMRYDWFDKESNKQSQYVLMVTHHNSEFSKTRFECSMDKYSSPLFSIQYLFGVGPHAHTIQ